MKKVNIIAGRILSVLSPNLFFRIAYIHHRFKVPRFRKPRNLSEIWIKKILDGKINNYYFLADKYLVRKYVSDKGYNGILTPLLGVYNSVSEIDYESLPPRFALKANWGAGLNLICLDKSNYSAKDIAKTVNNWLISPKFSYSERHYNLIKRCIICEEFIDDGGNGFPTDYKFMCVKGKVLAILVCTDRESGHADYIPYNCNWEPMFDYCKAKHTTDELVPKPQNLKEMIKIAEDLGEEIELVRIDLYSNGEKIWFGEITLTPDGCIFRRWTEQAINEMGEYYLTH